MSLRLASLIRRINTVSYTHLDAGNGKLGIELIEQYHPEIILIDISMPQMTGFDVISYIQKQALQTRFIIISGYDKFEYAQKAIQMGVQDFLLKSVTCLLYTSEFLQMVSVRRN